MHGAECPGQTHLASNADVATALSPGPAPPQSWVKRLDLKEEIA